MGETCVDVDASGVRLTLVRSLARESASLAGLGAPIGRGVLAVTRLRLFCLRLLRRGGWGVEVWSFLHGLGEKEWPRSPWLGEAVVSISWLSRWEDHHVVVDAK
jgi:hypothetical protein